MKIALACGGTGGHIFPGVATGEALRARGHEVTLWLAGKEGESEAIRSWKGAAITVTAEGLPSRPSPKMIHALWRLWRASRRCETLMSRDPPDAVLAMGSFASIGPVRAALRRGIPTVLHESNVIPGRANRLFYRKASAVAAVFEESRFHLRNRHIELTGMPLRRDLARAAAEGTPFREPDAPFTVLIAGGSRGAHRLNELAIAAIPLAARRISLRVLHLTGAADEAAARAAYARAGVAHEVHAFSHDMAALYRAADLVVCRAGASTCAELLAFGLPALLVPYPHAVRGHQLENARAMERLRAADLVEERDLESEWLAQYIVGVAHAPERRARMRAAALSRARLDAAEALAALVEQVVHESRR